MIEKKDVEKAERIVSALSRSEMKVTGIELIQFAQAFEWLALEVHKAKNPVITEPIKEETKSEPELKPKVSKKKKLRG